MDIEFLKQVLAVPNPSGHEEFLQDFVKEWCGKNGIGCRKDGKGNMFLTKGHADFYPCFTSHLDSVLRGADAVEAVRERRNLEIHHEGDKIYATLNDKPCVIGCDCKNGVAIALQCMKQLRAAKAAFYVEEETGCQGSQGSDMGFFKDCSFVIGLDSPDFNRAAKSCLGLPLFSDEFFKEQLEPICKKHGLTDFRAEPGTDIFFIRKDASNCDQPDERIECINFGNGGFEEHSDQEYASVKAVEKSFALALDLAKSVPAQAWHSPARMPPPPRWAPPPVWRGGAREYVGGGFSRFRGQPPGGFGRFRGPRQDVFDFGGRRDPDAEITAKAQLPDTAECAIAFKFSNQENCEKFVSGGVLELDVEIDEDAYSNTVSMSGKLGDLKEAWTLAFNAEEHTNYRNWRRFARSEDETDFWKDLVAPDAERKAGGDDVKSFFRGDDTLGDDDPVDVESWFDEDPDDFDAWLQADAEPEDPQSARNALDDYLDFLGK